MVRASAAQRVSVDLQETARSPDVPKVSVVDPQAVKPIPVQALTVVRGVSVVMDSASSHARK